jgi:hypothetical protein
MEIAESAAGCMTATDATRCCTTNREVAISFPTTTETVVRPGPRAITDPSGRTLAMVESPIVQVGRAPTRMLPFLSVTVAA